MDLKSINDFMSLIISNLANNRKKKKFNWEKKISLERRTFLDSDLKVDIITSQRWTKTDRALLQWTAIFCNKLSPVLTYSQEAEGNDNVPAGVQVSQSFVEDITFIDVCDDVIGNIGFQPVLNLNQITWDATVEEWFTVEKWRTVLCFVFAMLSVIETAVLLCLCHC